MPFAVEMFLDSVSADTVRGVWRDLAETGTAPSMHESGSRPHVTLGVCDRLDVDACARVLADFAAGNTAPAVRFASLGVFATDPAVVFLAPIVTPGLLALHDRFHHRFADLADASWSHYLPGRWVPHCTLGIECPLASVPRVIGLCDTLQWPLDGRLESVGIVEFRPICHLREFRFADGKDVGEAGPATSPDLTPRVQFSR